MEYTYEVLKKKTVADLRKIAKDIEHEALQGASQLNKEHLLEALCKALNIDMHVHHKVVGLDKASIKKEIKKIKKKREEAIAGKNYTELKFVRHHISHLKKKLHRATV